MRSSQRRLAFGPLALAIFFATTLYSFPSLAGKFPSLVPLPAEKLEAMAELLHMSDIALIESESDGSLRQISLMTFVAAPPKVVHDVVADLSHYQDFVHNVSKCTVTENSDGTLDQHFVINYTLINIVGVTRHHLLPDGAIEFEATDPEDKGHFRWEFHAVPGGTVLVLYGYTDVLHSTNLIRTAVKQAHTMEHGLALGAQLVPLRGVKQRAEGISGGYITVAGSTARPPGFGFLLDRGAVAVLRYTAAGRLSDLSLLERVAAPRERVEATILDPERYATVLEATPSSRESHRSSEGISYSQKTDIPVASWESQYLMRSDGRGGIDVAAVDGDLKGARYRWDLSAISQLPGGPKDRTLAVYRMSQSLASSSLALRALFKQEPLFEHGFGVALGLNTLEGIRARSEGRK